MVPCLVVMEVNERPKPSIGVRRLRVLHSAIGVCELGCLVYLWFCVVTHRRNRSLKIASCILSGEGVALVVANGCPLGIIQRRVGDDVSMFETWFGLRMAPLAIPTFTIGTLAALVLLRSRPSTVVTVHKNS